ncbi:MAG: formylglycine-generating enzyme family protein [Thermoanaerobaculia bacterium]
MLRRRATAPAIRLPWLRQLDYLPPWLAVGLGLGAGVALGVVLTAEASITGAVLFITVVGLAAVLAFSGEPVAVLEPVAKPESVPPLKRIVPPEDWVRIPAGTFRMGSPDDEEGRYPDEGPVHEVSVSAFECLRTPVPRRLYLKVMGEDPGSPQGDADERLVNNVSWFDALKFCNRLSAEEGRTPCYQIGDGDEVSWDRAADGYRLLTEAEWEYACRAGSRTRWFFGDEEDELGEYAWFGANSKNEPQPVGRKKPNAWGLYDMHGNVYEWCWDRFGPKEPQVDPPGSDEWPVVREGAFWDEPRNLRSGYRIRFQPEMRVRLLGFRCARRE